MYSAEVTTIKSLPTKIEEVALEIGAAMSGSDVYRTSVHDATGAMVWISAGTMDRTEQGFVLDALDCFALEPTRQTFEREIGVGRGLVAYAARDPRGALHGTLLLDVSLHSLGGRTDQRVAMPQFARLLQRLALRLAGDTPAPAISLAAHDGQPVTLYVQQLVKLRSAGRTRRYEVLLRTDSVDSPVSQEAPRDMLDRAEDPPAAASSTGS